MKFYGATTPELSAREERNIALARKAARDGFVLLQNDGSLPLQAKKLALYGMGARKTVAGGEGSGDVAPRYKVSIEQGLENAGYEIINKYWLDDYDDEYARTYGKYCQMVEEKIAGIQNPTVLIPLAHSYKYRYPSGRLVNEEDVVASDTDTALYVLMRQAGECADRRNEAGDFKLTHIETSNLKFLAAHYKHVVLVVNVGGLVDLSILDEVNIGAVVFFVQGGMEGGNALADVLSGKENFSGKLADSWPMRYEDITGGENFSSMNGDLDNEYYTEGVYVGYRYFDSFGVEPRWPFGFGLSYTTFDIKIDSVIREDKKISSNITVMNTGTMKGREVVQAYLSVPGDVSQSLCAFVKTGTIAPGDGETVKITFDLTENGVWCDCCNAWILRSGEYRLHIGNSSRNTQIGAVLTLTQTVKITQCKSCCAPENVVEEIIAPARKMPAPPDSAVRITIDPAAFATQAVVYQEQEVSESEWVKAMLDKLTAEEQIELVCGGDLRNQDPQQHQIAGAAGKTCITLLDKGVPNVLFGDGPAGVNVVEELICSSDGSLNAARVPERYNWGIMKQSAKKFEQAKGQHIYRYATAWPVEELFAQTWDTELMEEIGKAVGTELEEFGLTLWLAPGMNIHRNPLCGRTFEYYSEDPLITGKMAAALIRGVQSHSGIGATIKHFCCNNQEDNRVAVSSNVNTKALRQIYLKGFEIAVKDSKPLALMTSYNKLNGQYTGMRTDLVADILRSEWGYTGLVMTDWGTKYDPAAALQATTDLIMPGSDGDKQVLLAALENNSLNTALLRRSAARVLRIVENGITNQK